MKIYTKTGDSGDTGLFDGTRVSKADPRVWAYGDVDELNAVLGLARASGVGDELSAVLGQIQCDLFALGAQLADPRDRIADRVSKAAITDADVSRLEALIDRFEAQVPPLRQFILPGGGTSAAALHFARAVCRRAERRIVGLDVGAASAPPLPGDLVRYVNRLSDLLFVLARVASHRSGAAEQEWSSKGDTAAH